MGFQVSPGVEVKEIDLTNVIPAVSTSIGGFSGYFKWGPINEISLLSSEKALLQKFGTPDSSVLYADPFFQAASFLEYGEAIKVVRAGNSSDFSNATDNGGADNFLVSSIALNGLGDGDYNGRTVGSAVDFAFTVASGVVTIDNNVSLPDIPTDTSLVIADSDSKSLASLAITSSLASGVTLRDVGAFTYNKEIHSSDHNVNFSIDHTSGAVTINTNSVAGIPSAGEVPTFDVNVATTTQVDNGTISTINATATAADVNRTAGDYTAVASTTSGSGTGATFDVTVDASTGNVSAITLVAGGSGYAGSDTITIADSVLGGGGSPTVADVTFTVATLVGLVDSDTFTVATITATYTQDSYTTQLSFDGVTDNGVYIPNETFFEDSFSNTDGGTFAAKYAGAAGNGLKVYALGATSFTTVKNSVESSPVTATGEETAVYNSFDLAPDADEIHVAVIDVAGNFGVAGSVIEKFAGLSINKTAKTEAGATNYIKNVINTRSRYIYLIKGDTTAYTAGTFDGTSAGEFTLSGGLEASSLVESDVRGGLDLLADTETVDVNLIFSQIAASGAGLQNHAHKIAYQRKDAVAFISPPKSATVGSTTPLADVKTFNDLITNRGVEGSYGVIDSGAVYIYDRYNDVYRFIPANGHLAGLCANTDDVAEPWFSPAGFNRGGFRSIVKLAFNPTKAQRDELYKIGINPVASFPGQGTVLFGDKTAQSKPSAFDRINVRRLFIVLEKAIATAAKFQLFELNDEFTRATFRNAVEPFLRDVQGRRGITDFMVVCDDTNNTGEVIDTNRFVADIYIKPARSINFITLNFIATRTGVDFSEVAGLSNA